MARGVSALVMPRALRAWSLTLEPVLIGRIRDERQLARAHDRRAKLALVHRTRSRDPARQDLDHTIARRALSSGCVFALDSDAHTTAQLPYSDTALAHARLAGIQTDRIVNCWPLDRLLAWLSAPSAESRRS